VEQGVPLVTVVIPAITRDTTSRRRYKVPETKTHPRVEIVVVDDGPPTPLRLSPRLPRRTLCSPGEPRARGGTNRGLQEGTGEYVVFLDSDDRLHRTRYKLDYGSSGRPPAAAFAYGRCNLIDADGTWLATSERPVIGRRPLPGLAER